MQIVTVNKKGQLIEYSDVDIQSYLKDKAITGEKALSHSFLLDTLRRITGKTLTLIDSSITDQKQNKAMKDLFRSIISDAMDFSSEMAFNQQILQKMAEEHYSDMSDEKLEKSQISLDEALGVEPR